MFQRVKDLKYLKTSKTKKPQRLEDPKFSRPKDPKD